MKKLKYIILLLMMIPVSYSCQEDFLDKQPTDQLSPATFWKTEQDAAMGLTGVYNTLKLKEIAGTQGQGAIGHWDGLSDNAWCQYSWESFFQNMARGEINSTTGEDKGVIHRLYYGCYQGIAACNIFLENIDNVESANQDLIDKYKGEVRFIRAFFYYWLTQCYGDVPLLTRTLPIEEMNIPRSPKADILTFMYEDLDFAIANLPDEAYSGHIVKGSALAFKARIKLFNEEYADAATLAKQVIDSQKFSLGDYRSNFLEDFAQDACPEVIFSIKYLGGNSDLNRGDLVYGKWQSAMPFQELVDAHEVGDLRRAWNLILVGEEWPIGYNTKGEVWRYFPEGKNLTKVGLLKWVNPSSDNTNIGIRGNDVVHIRLAEVFLVYAEAQNEASGVDQSVYDAVNIVRQRAGLADLTLGLSKAEMREKIRNERRIELCFEAQRYFDLKRWDTAKDIIPTLFDPPGQTVTTRKWEDRFMLWPIPQAEIDKDPEVLTQNTGY
jgi:hypothetical protein